MDAIKKKMLAMKMEKENAVDRAEQNEQKLRDTEEQKAKIEEDLNNLQKKCANLENDFDNVNEQLQEAMAKLETSEKRVTEDPNEETVERLETSENSAQSSVSMGESLLSVEPEYSGCVELSQESQISTQDLSQGSTDIPLTTDGAKPKKKKSSKKVKKKKDKDKDKSTKDKSEKSSKSKSGRSSSRRPEPEGGNAPASYVDDYERIIYSNDALFSDVEITDEDYANFNKDCRKPHRANRQGRDGAILIPCTQLGINSNTMIKFAIIGTELQNVIQVSLKRVGIADIDVHVTRVHEMFIGVYHCIYFPCKQITLFR